MAIIDIDDVANLNDIIRQITSLIPPISISLYGRLIPFRTREELESFISGFEVCWDILDDKCGDGHGPK